MWLSKIQDPRPETQKHDQQFVPS